MDNEQTKKINTKGNKAGEILAGDEEPLSEYQKALDLVERREDVTKEEKEILDRKEKLAANAMIGGTTGGNVPARLVDPEDQKKINAAEMFKGTALEKAILPDEKN